jgi:GTPase SAR1 family protein
MGIVLVYDVTRRQSFVSLKRWLKEIEGNVGEPIPIVLCGNKCDIEGERAVDASVAQAFARSMNLTYFETSAKTNLNIGATFEALVERILRASSNGSSAASSSNNQNNTNVGIRDRTRSRSHSPEDSCC